LFSKRSTQTVSDRAEEQLSEIILAGLADIIDDVTGIEPEESKRLEASFVDDLDIDSLSIVEIVVQVEDTYGVKIPNEDIAGLRTVDEALQYALGFIRNNSDAACVIAETIDPSYVHLVQTYTKSGNNMGIIRDYERQARNEYLASEDKRNNPVKYALAELNSLKSTLVTALVESARKNYISNGTLKAVVDLDFESSFHLVNNKDATELIRQWMESEDPDLVAVVKIGPDCSGKPRYAAQVVVEFTPRT
jgi:acyl carrier protein